MLAEPSIAGIDARSKDARVEQVDEKSTRTKYNKILSRESEFQ
jgi:hypothetical protein